MRGLNPDIFKQTLSKNSVSGVTGVSTASILAFSVTPGKNEGVSGVSNPSENTTETHFVTPVTPTIMEGVTRKPASVKGVTPETLVTPENEYVCNAIDIEALYETFNERAAIAECDGGLSREEAERLVLMYVMRIYKQ